MRAYTLTSDVMTENINNTIDVFLTSMVNEGVITKEQFEQCKDYRMIVAQRTVWGKMWKYITQFKKEDGDYSYVVKIINVNKEKTDDA